MDKVIADNWGLIHKIARQYLSLCVNNPALSYEDLTQAGSIGVLDAAKTYDAGRGSWASWAAFYIRNEIRAAVGIKGGNLTHINSTSLDKPLDESDPDTTISDTIPNTDKTPEERAIIEAERGIINAALDALPEQERQLAQYMRQGLSWKEAAHRMGYSPQRISQLRKSMRKHLAQMPSVCELLTIEANTRYYRHKGVTAFHSSGTSIVEDAFFARERMRELCRGNTPTFPR